MHGSKYLLLEVANIRFQEVFGVHVSIFLLARLLVSSLPLSLLTLRVRFRFSWH